jgi:hypothetical protein
LSRPSCVNTAHRIRSTGRNGELLLPPISARRRGDIDVATHNRAEGKGAGDSKSPFGQAGKKISEKE